jgi:hypothetical protein
MLLAGAAAAPASNITLKKRIFSDVIPTAASSSRAARAANVAFLPQTGDYTTGTPRRSLTAPAPDPY